MTKLEKIAEIIREYSNGAEEDVTAEDVLEGIRTVLDDTKNFEDEIRVETDAGTLIGYKGTDPGNPSVGIMLKPKGEDFEFDLAYAEVKGEELRNVENSTEEEGDVTLYTYGDVFTEDYTSKAIIRRKAVIEQISQVTDIT